MTYGVGRINVTEMRGSRVTLTHEGRSLIGNALDDPSRRDIEVLLPPGYSPEESLPVVYWLAGFGSRPSLFLNPLAFGYSPIEHIWQAMACRTVPRAVVVVPDCTTIYGGSQYIDGPATGRYLSYLLEVVDEVDRAFHTRADPVWRAVGGKSSGGYGALIAAMCSDKFGSILVHSPDAGFEHSYLPLLPGVLDTITDSGGLERFLADRGTGPYDSRFMVAMSLIAMGMCYAEDPGIGPAEALPCDPRTGVFRPDVWDQWLRHDPVRLVPTHSDRLRALQLLYLDTGQRDEYNMHWGARALHATLDEYEVPHEYQEHAGGHHGIEHRFVKSLTSLARVWQTDAEEVN